jgi:copper chaperone CopZ
MKTADLTIEGMTCGHCVMAVQKGLGKLPGVRSADVTIGRARVEYDEGGMTTDDLSRAIKGAGYRVTAVSAGA